MKLVELILFISIICIVFLNLTKSLNPNMIDLMILLSSLFFMIQAKQASNKKNKKIYIKLLLLGDGPDREKIKDKIRVAGLEDTILLLGNVENPYVWIKHAELLVHSSKYEGLPTILIEALVLKKYIISSECSTGPKEILRNGQLGKLYKVGDYKTLAELIQNKIIHDESIDEKIIENNIKEYNKELVIEKYEALFEEK